ncbi:MAG: T9SS type A sorting domain-containing protein [bacterium]
MKKKIAVTIILMSLVSLYSLPSNCVGQTIKLTWISNPESDIKYYGIYRASTTSQEMEIAQVPATDTTYFDQAIELGKIYYYRITAVDSADNVSEFSDMIEVRTDIATSVDPSSGSIPEKFELSQNYPNPFNPETKFTYFVTAKSNVSLIIYDLLGRKVKTLVHEFKEPGNYSIIWNGRDDFSNKVSSGLYLARMVAGNYSQIRKIVLQK